MFQANNASLTPDTAISEHQAKKAMGHQRKISSTTEFKELTKKVIEETLPLP